MALYKNTASQKIAVYAYTASTGAAKTGDAAQITGYISKDWAAAAQITDTNPTELDATNMKGWYVFDLAQAETNANVIVVSAVSSTSGVLVDQYQVFTQASVDQTGDAYARLGAPAGASVSADVAAVKAQTDDIGVAGAGLSAIPWNAAWDAEVQSEATDALNAYDPPTKAELDAADDAVLAAVAALNDFDPAADTVAHVTLVDTTTTNTDMVSEPPTVGAIADAVWDEAIAGHAVVGSTGAALSAAGAAGDPWATVVPGAYGAGTAGEALGVLTDASFGNSALLNEIQALPAAPSAADVADAVWDEAVADHAGVGSTGEALAGATAPTADTVADAVWDELSTGHTDAGKAGQQLWTDIDAIKAKTDAIDTATITVVSGISGATLTLIHAATFDVTVTGLTIPSDWTKVLATLKRADTDTDADALAQAQASNPAAVADGLIRLNGAAPGAGEAVWSVLTVDQAAGSVRWVLHQPATATLKPRAGRWDLKVLTADSPVEGTPLVVSSPANVVYTTTRSVS